MRYSTSLSSNDVFWWLCDEPTNPMVITALLFSEGEWTPESLKAHLWPHVKDNVRLRGVPEKGRGLWWSWVPVPDFQMEDHIRLHLLPAPTDECLTSFLNEETSVQLPRHRPLWKLVILHNIPKYKSALLVRIHHVIADGTSLAAWIASLSPDATPQTMSPLQLPSSAGVDGSPLTGASNNSDSAMMNGNGYGPPKAQYKSVEKASKSGGVFSPWTTFMQTVLKAMDQLLLGLVVNLWTISTALLMPKDSNSPFKGPASGRYVTATTLNILKLPLAQLKEVGKRIHPKITVNDVLCALMAGSFRRYFSDYCHLHPEEMAMRVTIPINTRHPLEPIRLENRFSLVFKTLPVHKETVEERIASFHNRMTILKRSAEPMMAMFIMGLLTFLPLRIFRMVLQRYTRRSSAVMTNVPGALVPLQFGGEEVRDIVFFVPQSGDVGMGVSFVSYCGHVNIGLIVDRRRVPDLKPLMKYISEEWDQIMADSKLSKTNSPLIASHDMHTATMLGMMGFKETR